MRDALRMVIPIDYRCIGNTFWLVVLSCLLPANIKVFFFIQQAQTTNQPTAYHVCTTIVYCRSITKSLIVVCCCAFQLSLCARLLSCVLSLLQFPLGSKHFLLSVVFFFLLCWFALYMQKNVTMAEPTDPFFHFCRLCFVSNTKALSSAQTRAALPIVHCLSLFFPLSSRQGGVSTYHRLI